MRFLTHRQLQDLNLITCGEDVRISERAVLYGSEHMSIGSHVRIDDFAILHAQEPMRIGSYVHIGAYTLVAGRHGITIEDFGGLSNHVQVLTGSEDFSGATMANPTVPDKYKANTTGPVHIGRHAMVAAHSTVLPNVTVAEGAVVGAHSLANRDLDAWMIYGGVPAKRLKERSRDLLVLEQQLLSGSTEVSDR